MRGVGAEHDREPCPTCGCTRRRWRPEDDASDSSSSSSSSSSSDSEDEDETQGHAQKDMPGAEESQAQGEQHATTGANSGRRSEEDWHDVDEGMTPLSNASEKTLQG